MNNFVEKYLLKHSFTEWNPQAVLFDMDGVLYNSMPNHAKAWHDSMAEYGIHMSEEEAYAFEGMRGYETIKIVAGKQWGRVISDEESDEMYRVKSAHYAACPTAGLIPGILELQQDMVNAGLRLGVVTGSGQHSLLERLRRDFHGILSPDIMVTALNIKRGKPAPDPYLMGMQMARTKPWQTIVVENAPLGVRAAVAARCFTVAVNTGPLPDEALLSEGADIVFPDMITFRQQLPTILP